MKTYRKTIILTLVITLLPILAGLFLWNKLPDKLPSHWGINGQVDGWNSKRFTVFFLPCIMAAGQLLLSFCLVADPKKKNIHPKMLIVSLWIIPLVSIFMNGTTYLTALGVPVSMTAVVTFLIGVLFLFLGNYLPKLQQNYTIGIRVPWALTDDSNWERTHRFGGKVFFFAGILMILLTFLSGILGDSVTMTVLLVFVLVCVLLPAVYSYLIYKGKL